MSAFWTGPARSCALALAFLFATVALPQSAAASWFSENFEVHGFVTSKAYFRVPGGSFGESVTLNSWRNELNLEFEARIYNKGDWRIGAYAVVRPIYDAIYEVQHDLWGKDVDRGAFGTAPAEPDPLNTADKSSDGDGIVGGGGRIDGEFTVINSDTGTLYTGRLTPAVDIDRVVFFGRVTAPWRPTTTSATEIGGNASISTYEDLFRFGLPDPDLDASLDLAGTETLGYASGEVRADVPFFPLNFYAGASGDKDSLKHSNVDFNRRESDLKFDCRDNAHPYCALRELYIEVEYKNTFMRLGRQQIVWGKTDAFRLQDKINPLDVGYHNVFPDLEERRIPIWSLDIIHAFGDVGPLQDFSLEFVWVFDRFIPDQVGQCGEPWAFTLACHARADVGGHALFNFGTGSVDEVKWSFKNTEPGIRLEFRIPKPSIAFSLSAFWTHQDAAGVNSFNLASYDNPNAASMLFLQGFGVALPAFDPLARDTGDADMDGITTEPLPGSSFDTANQVALATWQGAVGAFCAGLNGGALGECITNNGLQALALPWGGSEFELHYPRVLSLGASMDYQIPGVDTVLRMEFAYDFGRSIVDTGEPDGAIDSDAIQFAIGLDRSTFIPFLNRNRTAFLSFQTFVEHLTNHNSEAGRGGTNPYENSVISTFFMQNYWRNDSLVLTSFVAVDWQSGAVITGPYFRWVVNSSLFLDVGVNILWGRKREWNIRDFQGDDGLGPCNTNPSELQFDCIIDPRNWQPGNYQYLNAFFKRVSETPYGYTRESFGDRFMQDRDEFWMGVTYQF